VSQTEDFDTMCCEVAMNCSAWYKERGAQWKAEKEARASHPPAPVSLQRQMLDRLASHSLTSLAPVSVAAPPSEHSVGAEDAPDSPDDQGSPVKRGRSPPHVVIKVERKEKALPPVRFPISFYITHGPLISLYLDLLRPLHPLREEGDRMSRV
jgi:hypothetical protein